jgi:hypothetical protein
LSNVYGDLKKRLSNTADIFTKNVPADESLMGSINKLPERALQVAGQGFGLVNDVAGEGAKSAYRSILPDEVQKFIQEKNAAVIKGVNTPPIRKGAASLADMYGGLEKRFPEGMRDVEAVANIAGGAGILKGAGALGKEALGVVPGLGGMVKQGVKDVAGAAKEKAINLIKPKPTEEGALKQVLQGKTKDLAKGKAALGAIDTEGVKTYTDLNKRIATSVKDYAGRVDAELMKDPAPHPLADLAIKTKTAGEEIVTQNHVEEALGQLKELYTKINDPVRAKEIEELTIGAQKQGLTKKQVNDISRIYGQEFKDKAFSKVNGDQLTSVNAQAYENTRKGLKETARQGMGPEAQKLDATLSSMLNTRRLIEKNIEAVNKFQGKIDPRSPLEKVGRFAVKTADTLSGGLVRGVIGGLLPRGVGNKMMNALDLEEKLSRNLKILEDALKNTKGKVKPNPFQPGGNFNTGKSSTGGLTPTSPTGTGTYGAKSAEVEKITGKTFPPAKSITEGPKGFEGLPPEPEIVAPGAMPQAKLPITGPPQITPTGKAQKGNVKGPENLITYLEKQGGVNYGDSYNLKELKQDMDVKRTSRSTGESVDNVAANLNAEGFVSPDGQPFTADTLVETIKTGQGRNIFTPEKRDVKIEQQLRREQNAWAENELAKLREEGIDPGSTAASDTSIHADALGSIKEQGTVHSEEAALKEISDYFAEAASLKTTPKGQFENTDIPGMGFKDTFSLTNPETQWGKLKTPRRSKQTNLIEGGE